MITALLAILVTATFSIVMLGAIMSQIEPTQLQQATTRTVFAAESGINAAVGQIRNAQGAPDGEGKVYGDVSKLPCTTKGTTSSGGIEADYAVTVQYFVEDPTGKSLAWRAANKISCVPGSGPVKDPTHALLTSAGTSVTDKNASDAVDRTLEVVYAFKVTNTNIPGGYIYSWDKTITPDRWCLEATSVGEGAYVKYVPASQCGDNDVRQLWVYDTDYRIKLASTTVPSAGVEPLCITATPNGSTPVRATLEKCQPKASTARWNQLWSWEGGATWRGENSGISNYSDYWLSSGTKSSPTSSSYLYVWNQAGADAEWSSFNPDPRVGAGAAGANTYQIVNYLEFGRCADVTHANLSRTQMIVYPCKQDPSGGSKLAWNHKWYYIEPTSNVGSRGPQQIYINNGTKYCLQSAGTEGGFVTFTSSCSTSAKSQQWTRYANTGNYDTSYTFVDGYGRCLDLGPWYMQGTSSQEAWSTMVTNTCNSTLGQKWNAPPDEISGALSGYWELP